MWRVGELNQESQHHTRIVAVLASQSCYRLRERAYRTGARRFMDAFLNRRGDRGPGLGNLGEVLGAGSRISLSLLKLLQ